MARRAPSPGSDDKTVRVWDPVAGRPLPATLEGHTEFVFGVAAEVTLPDGTPRTSPARGTRRGRVWDPIAGGAPHARRAHGDVFGVAAFTLPDGTPARVSGSDD